MRKLLSVLLAVVASPSFAASYSVGVSATGPGQISPISFAGFNGNLGTLTSVVFDLSGTTTYDLTLNGSGGPGSLAGAVSYSLNAGTYLYLTPSGSGNSFNTVPYLQQSGSGTATAMQGAFQAVTSGSNALTTITDAASLTRFVNTGFGGYYQVNPPFSASLSLNGNPAFIGSVSVASKNLNGTVTYNYTAAGAAVPEPATWGLMLAGFGLVGAWSRSARMRLLARRVSA